MVDCVLDLFSPSSRLTGITSRFLCRVRAVSFEVPTHSRELLYPTASTGSQTHCVLLLIGLSGRAEYLSVVAFLPSVILHTFRLLSELGRLIVTCY